MARETKPAKNRKERLLELWHKYQIDPEVAKRAEELAQAGRKEELQQLVSGYLANHAGIQAAIQYNREHPEKAIPWRELKKRQRRGRKRL